MSAEIFNFPLIETATLDNGMTLVVANRGSVPLVDVAISINTGSAAAPADAPGIGTFMFALMDKGTRQLNANELAAEKDKIAMASAFRNGLERSSCGTAVHQQGIGVAQRGDC